MKINCETMEINEWIKDNYGWIFALIGAGLTYWGIRIVRKHNRWQREQAKKDNRHKESQHQQAKQKLEQDARKLGREDMQHIKSIRPLFKILGAGMQGNRMDARIENRGGRAKDFNIRRESDYDPLITLKGRQVFEPDDTESFTVLIPGVNNMREVNHIVYLDFADDEGNTYRQTFKYRGNKTLSVTDPRPFKRD